ncbi:hypothetical protein [Nocardioides solisilvae]|uniref:hypothetical protein n=1 Tax=Nocardioides solisilvae TaxID=1542435 RepID=UPI000D743CC0|nr:hypothetical protein [Nocardioides solisilvae]
MKKLIAGAAAAGLLTAGLVGTAGTANAAPYPGSVVTDTKTQAPLVIKRNKVKIKVDVGVDGNVTPKGKLIFIVKKPNGKKVKRVQRTYKGKKRYSTGDLPRGKYKMVVKFVPNNKNSVYKRSRDVVKFKVQPN